MAIVTVLCEVSGIRPLLMNRFPFEDGAEMTSGVRSAVKKDYGTPRHQAEKTAYRTDGGELYLPVDNIYSSIIEAGKFHKFGRSKITTAKSSLVPAGIDVIGMDGSPMLIVRDKSGTILKDFEIDSRRVVIPSTGVPVIRHRARLDEWSVRFQIEIDNEVFTPDIVRLLVDDAGKKIGVGDFRPQRKGRYGKFVVTEWAEG